MSGQDLNADKIVEFIADIFERRGAESYLGEPVTMSEHMLQGAWFAEQDGRSRPFMTLRVGVPRSPAKIHGPDVGLPCPEQQVYVITRGGNGVQNRTRYAEAPRMIELRRPSGRPTR